jgi:hypothetical protein
MRTATTVTLLIAGLIGCAAAQLPPGITLRKTADFGLAMTGGGTSMWNDSEEQMSLRAQRLAGFTITEARNRDREGNLAIEAACNIKRETSPASRRATNLADYASMMRTHLMSSQVPASAQDVERTSMVAMNRIHAYSSGYEKGALDALFLVFALEPNAKQRICAAASKLARE